MNRRTTTLVTIFLLALAAFAAEESLDKLKARVTGAKPQEQPKLYAKIVDLEMKEVSRLFDSGDSSNAQQMLSTLTDDCEKGAQASVSTRKHMKQMEISLRKISEHLDQVRKSVDFESRPPVQSAIDRIEQARNRLLTAMFSK